MKVNGNYIMVLKDNDGVDCVVEMGEGHMEKDGYVIIVDGSKVYIESPIWTHQDILKLMRSNVEA